MTALLDMLTLGHPKLHNRPATISYTTNECSTVVDYSRPIARKKPPAHPHPTTHTFGLGPPKGDDRLSQ